MRRFVHRGQLILVFRPCDAHNCFTIWVSCPEGDNSTHQTTRPDSFPRWEWNKMEQTLVRGTRCTRHFGCSLLAMGLDPESLAVNSFFITEDWHEAHGLEPGAGRGWCRCCWADFSCRCCLKDLTLCACGSWLLLTHLHSRLVAVLTHPTWPETTSSTLQIYIYIYIEKTHWCGLKSSRVCKHSKEQRHIFSCGIVTFSFVYLKAYAWQPGAGQAILAPCWPYVGHMLGLCWPMLAPCCPMEV